MKQSIFLILFFITAITFSQKLTTQYHNKFYVYQEKDSTYTIKDKHKKIKFKNLKYAHNAGRGLQILTSENKVQFLDTDLTFIVEPILEPEYYCGTVENFSYKIKEEKNEYKVVKLYYGFNDFHDKNIINTTLIRTIPKKNVIDLCFKDGTKQIYFDENFYKSSIVIVHYKEKQAIATADSFDFFDSVHVTPYLKVRKKNKWGYYGITQCIFDKLDNFNYNLASFIQDKKRGYIDTEGNLYYEK